MRGGMFHPTSGMDDLESLEGELSDQEQSVQASIPGFVDASDKSKTTRGRHFLGQKLWLWTLCI